MNNERTSRRVESGPGQHSIAVALDSAESVPVDGTPGGRVNLSTPLPSAADPASPFLQTTKAQVLAHLDRMCKSPSFESSKRCQQFLRYIVLETVEGRGGFIKERNIATEVFGKGIDFEPGEDSVVRVKAREVRKRLTEYYESSPPNGLRIELPLGGYAPRLHGIAAEVATPAPHIEPAEKAVKPFNRRRFAWTLAGSLGVLGGVALWPVMSRRRTPLDRLWQPIFDTQSLLVIFIPIVTDRANGALTDRVGIGPAAALRRAADFLDSHKYPYHLRFGADLTFAQLREQPSLLLGGFSSIWTHLMTRNLRFSMIRTGPGDSGAIVDNQDKKTWEPLNRTPEGYADQDYGILCRLFDQESGQIAMIAGGLTTFGTEGAATVFFDSTAFSELVKQAPRGWEKMNFEAVIRVAIIGATPSSPQLVAVHFW